jgi:ATP adenylyltransferase
MKYHDFLTTLKTCPFCPSEHDVENNILGDSEAYLTYSIAPYHQDHLLVIPHRHLEKLGDLSASEMISIDRLIKQGISMLNTLGHENISVIVREGKGSGKTVEHLHYHIVPDIVLEYKDSKGGDREVLGEEEKAKLLKRLRDVAN